MRSRPLVMIGLDMIALIVASWAMPAALLLAADPATGKQQSAGPRLLVPAYFYPAGEGLKHWDRLLEAAERGSIVAVVNPASGPGKAADPNYVNLLERARKTKITILGYVSTSYAKRPLADVKADVDGWPRMYGRLAGVFFDEQASGGEQVNYYAELAKHAREKAGAKLVVTNPGTVCDERFVTRGAADVACLFEGPKAFESGGLPGWAKRSSDRVLLLSYKVGTADAMRKCLRSAAAAKIGYVYVTDADGANPWERLPSYWDEEIATLREMQRPEK